MGGNSGNCATVVRDLLTTQKDTMERIVVNITPKTLDTLEEYIGGILVSVKSTHYDQGAKYVHLAVILGKTWIRNILNDPNFLYNNPVDQGAYDPEVIANSTTAANRSQMEAQHKLKNNEYQTYLAIETGTKELIKYAVGDDTLAPLKKRFIEVGDETPQTMIIHLRDKVCLKLTAPEKEYFKRIGYQKSWDVTQNISTYFKYLDNLQDRLDTRVIPTPESEKQWRRRRVCTKVDTSPKQSSSIRKNKAEADKTRVNLQTYFTDLYQSQEQFTKATARNSMYCEETNHVGSSSNAQTVGSNITNGIETAMMMSALQDKHINSIVCKRQTTRQWQRRHRKRKTWRSR